MEHTRRKVSRLVFSERKNVYGEYVIKVYDSNGEHWEAADYYTDDKEDAVATYKVMQRAIEIQDRQL